MSKQQEKLKILIKELEAKGLKSIHICPGDVEDAPSADEYYAEFCRLLESIKDGSGSKLVFKDSQKK